MEPTFEQGVAVGMLLKQSVQSAPKKDAMFEYIINNLMPTLTIKFTNEHKMVFGLIDGAYGGPNKGSFYYHGLYTNQIRTELQGNTPIKGYMQNYIYESGVTLVTASILYKNNTPMWAKFGYSVYYQTQYMSNAYIYKLPYATQETSEEAAEQVECVMWYDTKFKFVPGTVKYVGDFEAGPKEGNTYYYDMIGERLDDYLVKDASGNTVTSFPQTSFDVESTKYKADYVMIQAPYPNTDGSYSMIRDNRYPPTVAIDKVETKTVNFSPAYTYNISPYAYYNSSGNTSTMLIYTDLSDNELLNLDYEIMDAVIKSYNNPVYSMQKKPRMLN